MMRNRFSSLDDNPSQDEAASLVDLIPMLDMVFILLIFFVIFIAINKIIPNVVAIDPPVEGTEQAAYKNRQAVFLHVLVDGRLVIDGQPVALRSLNRHWHSVPGEVEIVAAPQVQAESLIAVMAELKDLGVSSVSLSLEK